MWLIAGKIQSLSLLFLQKNYPTHTKYDMRKRKRIPIFLLARAIFLWAFSIIYLLFTLLHSPRSQIPGILLSEGVRKYSEIKKQEVGINRRILFHLFWFKWREFTKKPPHVSCDRKINRSMHGTNKSFKTHFVLYKFNPLISASEKSWYKSWFKNRHEGGLIWDQKVALSTAQH